MKVVKKSSEAKLLEIVSSLRGAPDGYYALHYHLSKLQEEFRSEYQIKIAVNIINDLFKSQDSILFLMKGNDIILLYNGDNRALLEKAIFQLRYLFMDDPLGYAEDGYENEDFCSVYDLEFQWRDFFVVCRQRAEGDFENDKDEQTIQSRILTPVGSRQKLQIFSPAYLTQVISEINNLDIKSALRSQPVCAVVNKNIKSVFNETYVNIRHLQDLMSCNVDLLSGDLLFKYVTETFDKRVLKYIQNKDLKLDKSVSINLNVKTLMTEEFAEFDRSLDKQKKSSIIFEINIANVFEDIHKFVFAKEELQKRGYRICLDGLDDLSFLQIDRKSLGFDLVKLKWNKDMGCNNSSEKGSILANAVKECGANRIILCHCDDQAAIDFGKSIGVSLFQGRYIDKMISPNSKIVN